MTKIVNIVWLVNNLRNILMSGNSQKKYFDKSYYVPNSYNQKNIDILKNPKK